jgi:hypothetical protein
MLQGSYEAWRAAVTRRHLGSAATMYDAFPDRRRDLSFPDFYPCH